MKKSIEKHLAQKAAQAMTGVHPRDMGKGKRPMVGGKKPAAKKKAK